MVERRARASPVRALLRAWSPFYLSTPRAPSLPQRAATLNRNPHEDAPSRQRPAPRASAQAGSRAPDPIGTLVAAYVGEEGSVGGANMIEAREVSPGEPIDLLLVDDHPRNLEATRALLSAIGTRIVEARSAEEALRLLLSRDVALILLDINLPGMSGLELASLVRARERTRLTPIIFVTASSDVRLLERGYALGAVDFLTTPVPEQALRAKVAFFIEAHRKNEALRRNAELLRAAQERELARNVAEARRLWEEEALRREVERDRKLVDTLHRANERLKLLSSVRSDLLSAEIVRERLPAICDRVSTHLGLERWALHVAGPDGRMSLAAAGGVAADEAASAAALEDLEAILGGTAPRVSGRGEPAAPIAEALGMVCCTARPRLGGRVVATLAFGSAERDACDPDDPATLELVGYAVSMALERDRLIAELQGRNEELREADRRKDQFLAMLAHELRNPLAPVRTPCACSSDYGARRPGARAGDRARGRQVRPHDPARGRPPRRVAHPRGKVRAAQAARGRCARWCARRGSVAELVARAARIALAVDVPAVPLCVRRTPPARPNRREPPHQRREVHATPAATCASSSAHERRARRCLACGTTASVSRRAARRHLRAVRAGGAEPTHPRRPRYRARAREGARRDARRRRSGGERRTGEGNEFRVRLTLIEADRRAGAPPAAAVERASAPRRASSSSRTTATSARRSRSSSAGAGTRCARRIVATRRSSSRARRRRRSRSSTSGSRSSTASRSRSGCASSRRTRRSSRSPATAAPRTGAAPRRRGSAPTS